MANTDTIQSFLNVFAQPIAVPATAITTVVGLFSPNVGTPPTSPSVGIGGNNQALGPSFTGHTDITALFSELLSSFPHLVFTAYPIPPANAVFCIAQNDPNTIIIQAQLNTGLHVARWFPPDDPVPAKRRYYSKPLSDLVPAKQPANQQQSTVPVCAVFTFDTIVTNRGKILNLALYLDRWRFATDLWVHGPHPFPHP
jgi:hypothetical protein